jgi:hypothetical protein
MRTLTALVLAALCGPQEPSAPIKWAVKLDSRFTMQFNFVEQYRSDIVQKSVGTAGNTVKGTVSHTDKREIEAELSYREVPGREWSLSIDLKKISWTYSSEEAEVTLTFTDGKEPQTRVAVKEKDKFRALPVKADADNRAEHMKRLVMGEYDLAADRSGQVTIIRKGAMDPGFSIFGRSFVQPPCPLDPVTAGQAWKDAVPSLLPGAKEADVADLPFKVTALNEKSVTVKGAVNLPLTKPQNANDVISGTFSLEREFVFSREGYVQSSREEHSYKKTAKSSLTVMGGGTSTKDETITASLKQSVTLKPRR